LCFFTFFCPCLTSIIISLPVRIIVADHDLDFSRLLAITGVHSPGIILFRGGNYSESEMKMLTEQVLNAIADEEMEKSIVVVDKIRIRKVKLPT
jgi:predicted nuclease of predicted toxin-antitoxin system